MIVPPDGRTAIAAAPSSRPGCVPGYWRSTDRGRTWVRLPDGAPSSRRETHAPQLFPHQAGLEFTGDRDPSTVTSPDGRHLAALAVDETLDGQCGQPSETVLTLTRAKGLPDPGSGQARLRVSDDAGTTWRQVPVPDDLLSIVRTAHVLAGIDTCGDVVTSDDGGASWRAHATGAGDAGDAVRAGADLTSGTNDLWVTTFTDALHANGEGLDWTERPLPVDGTTLIPGGPGSATYGGAGTSYWLTTDAGATWRQHWPSLPGL